MEMKWNEWKRERKWSLERERHTKIGRGIERYCCAMTKEYSIYFKFLRLAENLAVHEGINVKEHPLYDINKFTIHKLKCNFWNLCVFAFCVSEIMHNKRNQRFCKPFLITIAILYFAHAFARNCHELVQCVWNDTRKCAVVVVVQAVKLTCSCVHEN